MGLATSDQSADQALQNPQIWCRVRTDHGKPGKSWNLFQFPGLESHGI